MGDRSKCPSVTPDELDAVFHKLKAFMPLLNMHVFTEPEVLQAIGGVPGLEVLKLIMINMQTFKTFQGVKAASIANVDVVSEQLVLMKEGMDLIEGRVDSMGQPWATIYSSWVTAEREASIKKTEESIAISHEALDAKLGAITAAVRSTELVYDKISEDGQTVDAVALLALTKSGPAKAIKQQFTELKTMRDMVTPALAV